jgi:hypothetical protein
LLETTGRPIVGFAIFNENHVDYTNTDYMTAIATFQHEAFHALFFHPGLFINKYPSVNGNPFYFIDSEGTPKIRGPTILAEVRKHFNCPTIDGGTLFKCLNSYLITSSIRRCRGVELSLCAF